MAVAEPIKILIVANVATRKKGGATMQEGVDANSLRPDDDFEATAPPPAAERSPGSSRPTATPAVLACFVVSIGIARRHEPIGGGAHDRNRPIPQASPEFHLWAKASDAYASKPVELISIRSDRLTLASGPQDRHARPTGDPIPACHPGCRSRPVSADTMEGVATKLLINRSDDAQGVVLALSGELDIASAPELEKRLSELLAEGHLRVVLDLNELSFVDSPGISVLIRAKHEAETAGRRLVLRRPTAQLHQVFALVGLVDWLDFDD